MSAKQNGWLALDPVTSSASVNPLHFTQGVVCYCLDIRIPDLVPLVLTSIYSLVATSP